MNDNEIRRTLERYKFYHVIQVTDGVQTAGWTHPGVLQTQAMTLSVIRSLHLEGKRVLDIGCRDGLFSFAAERQGAREVIGIDNDLSPGATEFLIPFFKSRVKMHQLNVYDLTPEHFGVFDVVIFAGVLYHLRFPFSGLKRISDVLSLGGRLVLETAIWDDDNQEPLLFCPVGTDSPYEPTSCTFFNVRGLTDSLRSFGIQVQAHTCLSDRNRPAKKRGATIRKRVRALLGRTEGRTIDRATFTCERTPVDSTIGNPDELRYWYGTHQIHTLNLTGWRKDPA
jgi:2-polyprenyl-3-methyl-5-hydroxy-6-metoxy-1,4-benzoquinol methylase